MFFHSNSGVLQVVIGEPPANAPYGSGYSFINLDRLFVIPWDAAAPMPPDTVYSGGLARSSKGALYVVEGTPSATEKSLGVPARTLKGVAYVTTAAIGQGSTFSSPWGMVSSAGEIHIDATFGLGFADLGAGVVSTVAGISGATPTFTRATTATTVLSNGLIGTVASGAPRSYYDPTTLEYLGYLAEGARTNLLLRSQEFDNASWSKTDTTITADAIVSPDGTQNADLLTEGTAGTALIRQDVIATADVNYAVSRFFKFGNTQWVRVQIVNGTNLVNTWFDIQNGVAGSQTVGGTGVAVSASVKAYPNGWYRCDVVGSVGSGATAISVLTISAASNGGARVNNSTRYEWGAQFENNVSFASSYIATVGATVTRNADVLTYPTTGWLTAATGTLFVAFRQPATLTASNRYAGIYLAADASNERLFAGSISTLVVTGSTFGGGVAQAALTLGTSGAAADAKIAYSYAANNFAGCMNGGTVATDATGTIPTVDALRVGHDGAGAAGTELFSTVRRLAYFPTVLSSAQKQGMTS